MNEETVLTFMVINFLEHSMKQNMGNCLKYLPEFKDCRLRRVFWICPSRRLVSYFSRVGEMGATPS